jgi:hypothetical protein
VRFLKCVSRKCFKRTKKGGEKKREEVKGEKRINYKEKNFLPSLIIVRNSRNQIT